MLLQKLRFHAQLHEDVLLLGILKSKNLPESREIALREPFLQPRCCRGGRILFSTKSSGRFRFSGTACLCILPCKRHSCRFSFGVSWNPRKFANRRTFDTTLGLWSWNPTQNPAEPRKTLEETPAETSKNPSQRQISSESLAEDCGPWMVTPLEL